MAEPRDRLDDLIRAVASDDAPTTGHRARAEAALARAMSTPAQRRLHGWRSAVAGSVALAVVAVTLIFVDVGGGTSATAAMEEIAHAIEQVPAETIGDDQFLYQVTKSTGLVAMGSDGLGDVEFSDDFLFFLEPRTRETWRGASGAIQFRDTVGEPSFFTAEAEAAFYDAGLDEVYNIGETITETFADVQIEDWPATEDALDAAIRSSMTTDRGLPETVKYLDVALDVVREMLQPPEVRASTLLLIGRLDGLDLVETNANVSTFAVEYTDRGVEKKWTFSIGSDGHLRFEEQFNLTADQESGIPANTAVWVASHSQPVVVNGLDEPAAP